MSAPAVLTIVILGVVVLALPLISGGGGRRRRAVLYKETHRVDRGHRPFLPSDRPLTGREVEQLVTLRHQISVALEPAVDSAPAPYVPPDPETVGVTRRQFFNRSIVGMMGLGLSGFGASMLAFLWPQLSGGFGSKITVGKLEDILGGIRASREPFYVAQGRFYISPYPSDAVSKAERVYSPSVLPGLQAGVVAQYQKCPHLGCRVPFCATSQWFECGCHGSQFNRVGEKKGGPAPRGMDLFPVEVSAGTVTVDTGVVVQGVPIGTNTTGQEAEGPHCVAAAGAH